MILTKWRLFFHKLINNNTNTVIAYLLFSYYIVFIYDISKNPFVVLLLLYDAVWLFTLLNESYYKLSFLKLHNCTFINRVSVYQLPIIINILEV